MPETTGERDTSGLSSDTPVALPERNVPPEELWATVLEHVLSGNLLARYVGQRTDDPQLKALMEDFLAAGEALEDRLRRRMGRQQSPKQTRARRIP